MCLKKHLLQVIILLLYVIMGACSLFDIADTGKDTELKEKADSIMIEIDSLIIDLDTSVYHYNKIDTW